MTKFRLAVAMLVSTATGLLDRAANSAPQALETLRPDCNQAELGPFCVRPAGAARDDAYTPAPILIQQAQTSYKYYCAIQGPSAVAQNWISQGRGQQPVMFNTAQRVVYFLGGVSPYRATGTLVTWEYTDNFTQQSRTASFDGSTNTLVMEGGTWACNYAGPGP
jgi:hypothetical protein